MTFRLAGAFLLCLCLLAVYRLHWPVMALPRHPPTAVEMLLSFFAVVTGIGGAMAVALGGDLFRRALRPRWFRERRSIDN